jgi:hypothetical protein
MARFHNPDTGICYISDISIVDLIGLRPDRVLYKGHPVVIGAGIEYGGPDAVRRPDARHDQVRDTKVPEWEIELRPDERTHPDLLYHALSRDGEQFIDHRCTGCSLNGKGLVYKVILPEDFDI